MTSTGYQDAPVEKLLASRSERTSLVVDDTELVLIPVRGGETPDALMAYLPASGVQLTGAELSPSDSGCCLAV
jgi:hypothetical protein